MKIIGIIPARFESTRFPGKPLVEIGGKTIIQRVYEQCSQAKSLKKVVVATDDQRIYDHVVSFGGEVAMTDTSHPSGTDRCAEVLKLYGGETEFDYAINIQGDEPFIQPDVIDALSNFLDFKTEIATSAKKITDIEELTNPNVVKVVLTMRRQALYFSRQTIPYVRGKELEEWMNFCDFFKHIGIYAFRSDVLEQIVKIPVSPLENTEKLEQLRWLGYGYKIQVKETEYESFGVDTPEDLIKIKALFDNK